MGRAKQFAAPLTPPQQRMVQDNVRLVHAMASKLMHRLPLSVSQDDVFSNGCIGLMDAARKFDPRRHVAFATYASRRIWGAMMDGLRGELFISRLANDRGQTNPQFHGFDSEIGNDAASGGDRRRFNDVLVDYRAEHEKIDRQQREDLDDLLGFSVDARKRRMLTLYFADDYTMREIGLELGLSESRISQEITLALEILRGNDRVKAIAAK